MGSPIYSATDAEGLTLEVFPRFFRVSAPSGDILAEYGAALIRNRRGNQHYIAIDPAMLIVDPELVLRYPLAEYPRRAWTPMVYFVRA